MTPEEIAAVVSVWTGIPVTSLVEGEAIKLADMEERLHERVVGQDTAIERGLEGDPAGTRRA